MIRDFNKLDEDEFENLVQTSAQRIISASAKIYDWLNAGRDVSYIGQTPYPNSLFNWDGHRIFQAKYHDIGLLGHVPARKTLLNDIDSELHKILKENNLHGDNYIIITNVILSSIHNTGTMDKLEDI